MFHRCAVGSGVCMCVCVFSYPALYLSDPQTPKVIECYWCFGLVGNIENHKSLLKKLMPQTRPRNEFGRQVPARNIFGNTASSEVMFWGDAVIFFLFFVQLRQPKPEVEWTDELKENYRRRWRCRSVVFWSISIVHIGACVLYLGSTKSNGCPTIWFANRFVQVFHSCNLRKEKRRGHPSIAILQKI